MQMLTRGLLAASAAAALALPATASAHRGAAHGHRHGPAQAIKHGRSGAPRPEQSSGRDGHAQTVAYVFAGGVKSVDATTVTVTVAHANHHGQSFVGQDVAFDVSAARIVVRDANGDGKRDLGDVAVGDRVLVLVRLARDASAPQQPLAASALVDGGQRGGHSAAAEQGSSGGSADGAGTASAGSTDSADSTDTPDSTASTDTTDAPTSTGPTTSSDSTDTTSSADPTTP